MRVLRGCVRGRRRVDDDAARGSARVKHAEQFFVVAMAAALRRVRP